MVKNFYWKIALLHKIENYYNHKISKVHRFILCRTFYFDMRPTLLVLQQDMGI